MDWDLPHRDFLLCLSVFCPKPSVTEVGLTPARIITVLSCTARDLKSKRVSPWPSPGGAGCAHPSLGWNLTCNRDGLCTSRGRWWQSFTWNYSNLEWGSALFPPFPVLAFPPRGKQPAKWLFANSVGSFSRRCDDEVKVVKHSVKERTSFCGRSEYVQDGHVHQNE